MKLLFDRCTDFSGEILFVEVGTSPANALLDKSMHIRLGKSHKQPGSTPVGYCLIRPRILDQIAVKKPC